LPSSGHHAHLLVGLRDPLNLAIAIVIANVLHRHLLAFDKQRAAAALTGGLRVLPV